MSIKSQIYSVCAGMAIMVALAGCGDESGDASGEAKPYQVVASTTMTVAQPPITKPQFVRRMNKLCRGAWVMVLDNFDIYSGTLDPKLSVDNRFREAVRLSVLAGIDFHIFDNFRILGSPKGEEEAIEKIIGPFQAAVETGQKNHWRAYSVEEITPHFADFNQGAQRYGLDDCLVNEAHLGEIDDSLQAQPSRTPSR